MTQPANYDHIPTQNLFVSICGLIGAGKSTLATALGKHLNVPVYYEPVEENVYLEDFYTDMKKYGFAMQIYLFTKRFSQHQTIIWSGKSAVQDRSIYEDTIFAKVLMKQGNMTERDYGTYLEMFRQCSNFLKHPNLLIYLDVSPEEAVERIKSRSRNCESSIPIEYLQELYNEYQIFIDDISKRIPVIKVKWDKFHTADEVALNILNEYKKQKRIIEVDFSTNIEVDEKDGFGAWFF
ncbi:Deoxynucleoside kinase / Deoxynucleoside kinase family protein [Spironucleus salmonicida]|uniref:Deoxynucleoside kinase family protein n=1 Tax=Spironucleus salmonicida TaxID=348837 RepID=V6LE15_9EUKA|nr:Deoxynucleoside kinase / Deoxynucleoside kinase family protein [Spironucleus salmonicida]|eukprot:EST42707.1 Deoxynucleoside kinase family protein [Spironucleus salmonicida]